MKRHLYILILLVLSFVSTSFAKNGDTLVIQTITKDTPVLDWWNAPREGIYDFPTDKKWSKILMYYNLKCDPTQNPKCGEWDYLTYTNLLESTGKFDSTKYDHPWFKVNGYESDKLEYINSEKAYRYSKIIEKTINYTNTESLETKKIDLGNQLLTIKKNDGAKSSKAIFVYKASELNTLSSKTLTGLKIQTANSNKCKTARIKIELKNDKKNGVSLPIDLSEMNTTYLATTNLETVGWHSLNFNTPFLWDGTSDIIVSITLENANTDLILVGGNTDNIRGLISDQPDKAIDMGFGNYINVPVDKINSMVDKDITISFWAYGDPTTQPQSASILEAVDADNKRVFNIHLPWGDGTVYWDCADGRTSKNLTADNWKGSFSFWTFTRNDKGYLRIYRNGKYIAQNTSNKNEIKELASFHIAHSITYGPMFYNGKIDNFYIFNKVLTEDEIQKLMNENISTNDEFYPNLVLGYNFDNNENDNVPDIKGESNGTFVGFPAYYNYGTERFKKFIQSNIIPNIEFESRVYSADFKYNVSVDTALMYPLYVVYYKEDDHKIVEDYSKYYTPTYYKDYTFNNLGQTIDSVKVQPDSEIINKKIEYYGTPFEKYNTWELGRFITPYGIGLDLGPEGWTWIYDVSDFAPLLKGKVRLQAGNWQELLDLKFVFIEGEPDRDVIKIENLWNGNIYLKDFDNIVTEREFILPDNAIMAKLRTTVTGHDFDNSTNCAEFCQKLHNINVNGNKEWEWQIIKECGSNPLYPQGGTWIHDRAGWCPGEPGVTKEFELTPFIIDGKFKADYNIQSDPYGYYRMESQMIYYGNFNHDIDVELSEILTPNNFKLYSRYNPACGNVNIIIQNRGKKAITQGTIKYGIIGMPESTFQWNGNLNYSEYDTITMPAPKWDYNNNNGMFYAEISINGDQKSYNNRKTVLYDNSKITEKQDFQFSFKTNKKPKETKWILTNLNTGWSDQADVSTFEASKEYTYNWELEPGCYRLTLIDSDGDGLSFWANSDGSGSAILKTKNPENDKYIQFYKFNPDFGSFINYDFTIDPTININHVAENYNVKIYPNPAKDYIKISSFDFEISKVEIYDLTGKKVLEYTGISENYDISQLQNGIYILKVFLHDNNTISKKLIKK